MQFATALTDISMLAQSSILAAQSLDINTLITNEIYHNKLDTVFEFLEIPPRYVFPMLAVCLGYSEFEHQPLKGRVSAEIIFHENRYEKLLDEKVRLIIQEYDDRAKNIGLIKDWDEKGHTHYLEWFFEKWCPNIGSRKQNDIFIDALKKHEMF
jgi:FMN reductase [NAD(P)H]